MKLHRKEFYEKQICRTSYGLLVCSAFSQAAVKMKPPEAAKESTEDENEGTGDTKDADSKKGYK